MSQLPFRKKDYACVHPETYKYFLDKPQVDSVWEALAGHLGSLERNPALQTRQIHHALAANAEGQRGQAHLSRTNS